MPENPYIMVRGFETRQTALVRQLVSDRRTARPQHSSQLIGPIDEKLSLIRKACAAFVMGPVGDEFPPTIDIRCRCSSLSGKTRYDMLKDIKTIS
jgi:hypothetical protein